MTAFTTNWPIQMSSDETNDFRTIYHLFVHNGRPLPSPTTTDDHLLILIGILSDIHFLLFFLGPLATRDPSSLLAWPKNGSSDESNPSLTSKNSLDDFNPFLPFTAKSQYESLRQALLAALNSWKILVFEEETEAEIDEQYPIKAQALKPLLHFCYLLLYAGPAVYVIMSLSLYPLNDAKYVTANYPGAGKFPAAELCVNDDSIKAALDLLEVLRSHEHHSQQSHDGSPSGRSLIWDPLLLFIAGLVFQSGVIKEQGSSRDQEKPSSSLLGSRTLLGMFVTELKKLQQTWDWAKDMGDIISKV
ncbi:hypothetical protein N7493_001658 [Penicillium malachiteum]|uniref:Uncharacterized protein n=1 Tax=Penicillium malachiteum TaxID=1324776 RepID=A0AAD6HVC4_9EURO|nr:hypothetical protein N7493_001658 [Penicillium malachiteum]